MKVSNATANGHTYLWRKSVRARHLNLRGGRANTSFFLFREQSRVPRAATYVRKGFGTNLVQFDVLRGHGSCCLFGVCVCVWWWWWGESCAVHWNKAKFSAVFVFS